MLKPMLVRIAVARSFFMWEQQAMTLRTGQRGSLVGQVDLAKETTPGMTGQTDMRILVGAMNR